MHEVSVVKMLDEGSTGVLDLLARQHRRVLARSLPAPDATGTTGTRPCPYWQEAVGADRLAGDPSDDAAVGPVLPAGQNVDQVDRAAMRSVSTSKANFALAIEER
jgi:hypothetical protein